QPDQIAGVRFSPQGNQLAIATSRRLRIWQLSEAEYSADIQCRHSIGKKNPFWMDDDLVLSSSGVLISVFRALPVWRYEIADVMATTVDGHIAMFRKQPETEMSVAAIPHPGAENALSWIDAHRSDVRSDRWHLMGRSNWKDGRWWDRQAKPSGR
ncbi:MAG: hypothetical protein MI861_19530, partial [Pirellulales bacterium]|nr:hypothetical protein [Pirellulales bacterium]